MSAYARVLMPLHPSANSKGYVYAHVLVAERALGRHLPAGVSVHHVDENPRNNANANLVICQDHGYHKLLHARARVVRAGGDPNTHAICGYCRSLKPFAEFNKSSASKSFGIQTRCRECSRATYRDYLRKTAKRRRAA